MKLARKPRPPQTLKTSSSMLANCLLATRFAITLISVPLGVAFPLIGSILKFVSDTVFCLPRRNVLHKTETGA